VKNPHIGRNIFIFLLIIFIFPLFSQETPDSSKTTPDTSKTKITLDSLTKTSKPYKGMFTFYQDTSNGSLQMLIEKNQFNKEFIHFVHTLDGVVDVGHFRGAYKSSKIFEIRKYFNRVEFVLINTSYYFDPKNPLSKASTANINESVLASVEIVFTDKKTESILIKADDVFLSENLYQIKSAPNPNTKPGARFSLGSLNKKKCQYVSINNYPFNSDIAIKYVFDNPSPVNRGGPGITDPRSVNLVIQHSFIAVPKNDYLPRHDDPRVGYFMTQVTDMTSVSNTPYRDIIHRWNLQKKYPELPISEPIKPIIFWIENTTPIEFRDAVKEGVLRWNKAFRIAGFKNAIEVKVQSDDADWEAGDIRYNVLRWTSSPRPPFGGYGPSFVNPRTGEILGADIMLEFVYFTNRVKYDKIYEELLSESNFSESCLAGYYLNQGNQFGFVTSMVSGYTSELKKRIINESLIRLVLHEVGHTLGLNHNFKSSYLHNNTRVHNKGITQEMGLTGSVMEYPGVNIAPPETEQGEYYTTTPGPYDKWAIEFGYSIPLDNNELEESRINAILSRSTAPELSFGNDADDMRIAGKGIDPQAMIYDMSSEPIDYASDRIALTKYLMDDLVIKYSDKGKSYQPLLDAFNIILRERGIASRVVSRHIGGIYVERSFFGQRGSKKPFKTVPYKEQKKAIKTLEANLFHPNAFSFPKNIFENLLPQRRGFNHMSITEDYKIHDKILGIQKDIFNHLLHPKVLKRISNTGVYGNEYSLNEFITDLTLAIYIDDMRGDVNTFRQNLQTEYTHRLIKILKPTNTEKYGHHAQSTVYRALKNIKNYTRKQTGVTPATSAHREYINFLIDSALSKD
jgi:hypothetical protein